MTKTHAAADYLQTIPSDILAAAARGELDLNALARQELASRGQDWNGQWIGFPKAKSLAACFPVKTARGVVPVSVPESE